MKNKFFIIATISLLGFPVLAGCTPNNKSDSEHSHSGGTIVKDVFIVRDSHTEYRVVVPKESNDKINEAADDLVKYIKASSNANMQIIQDNKIGENVNYISLGDTELFRQIYGHEDFSRLKGKMSSYFIASYKNNIYIYSDPDQARNHAIVYGVYDLLHDLIGYEFYAEDEIYYEEKKDINLFNYDNLFVEPSFDRRSIGSNYLINNINTCEHHRLISVYNSVEWASSIYGHSQVTEFVKPETVLIGDSTIHDLHPDWFSNPSATKAASDNNQLCWSAGPELEAYVAQRFIEYFQIYPESTYFMFGQEDNIKYYCNCDRCKHVMEEEAFNYAGLQIRFMNHVIAITEQWLKANQPNRTIKYVVFAYVSTKAPPVKMVDGRYVPINDIVVPHKDLYIMYAPIYCNFGFPLDNDVFNADTMQDIKGWSSLAYGQIIIYFYDVNFRSYLCNFGNLSTIKNMYKICKDYGVSFLYTQGAIDGRSAGLSDMRDYVESKLMWNVDCDCRNLVLDFMKHFYKDAYLELYEYYETLCDRFATYFVSEGDGGAIYGDILNEKLYPYEVVRYFTNLVEKKAMDKISHYQVDDPVLYQTLKNRIMKEFISIIFVAMSLYNYMYSPSQKAYLKEIFTYYCNLYSITYSAEHGILDIDALFE